MNCDEIRQVNRINQSTKQERWPSYASQKISGNSSTMTLLLYVNNGRFPRRLRLIEEVEPPSGFVNKQLIINWSMLRLHFAARREVNILVRKKTTVTIKGLLQSNFFFVLLFLLLPVWGFKRQQLLISLIKLSFKIFL